jgi:hypothetical protein
MSISSDNISEAQCLEEYVSYYFQDKAHWSDTSKKSKVVNGVALYRCTRCGQYKPKSDYYKDKRVPCGIRNRCKSCYHK